MADLADHTLASPSTFLAEYPNHKYCFDVFINHRGEVKNGLASHLYNRLHLHELRVFLDKREMEAGEHITRQLEGAIQSASVHIAIFSPNYAQSKWCLNELSWMLESGSTVIPVFYKVKPEEVRWAGKDTAYGKALLEHKEKKTEGKGKPRYEPETIEKWRKALSCAADLSGLNLEDYNGDEWELVNEIVRRVQKKVRKTPLHVATYPTGLEEKVEDLEKRVLLHHQSGNAQIAGIVGLGGIGKTTLAKEIFNRRRSYYPASCFLFDVREAAGRTALPSLQSKLLKDLNPSNAAQISSVAQGIGILRKFLVSCHGLIVLDDVDHAEQLDALLLPVKDVLRPGSLVLVTSRSKEVLTRWGIVESSIYSLKGLQRPQSEELFCSHAFHQPHPVEGFEKIVAKFLEVCDGLPLSLKVIGALLHGEDNLEGWKSQFNKISRVLPDEVQKTLGLKISYDSLDEEEKDIFLDIACFFLGEDKDKAIRIWDGSGWQGSQGLRKLENKCLVEVDSKNCIRMHDHLRDMGRDLAEKEPPGDRRRLYRPTDLTFHRSFVRGISMVPRISNQSSENPAGFSNCLQLLRGHGDCFGWYITNLPRQSDPIWNLCCLGLLGQVRAERDCEESISNLLRQSDLQWLCWDDYPYTSLPPWIPIKNLKVLEVKGWRQLETLWPEHESEVQAPLQLRELNIDAALLELPMSIGQLNLLEKIELKELIRTLPEEFFQLSSLKHIRLSTRMTSLPNSFSKLRNLQHIDLSGSTDLQTLPSSLGNLRNLRHIDLSRCGYLQTLPSSFGKLTNLQHINLNECFRLQMLPYSFGSLLRLKHLSLASCHELTFSSETLGDIIKLERLDLSRCSKIEVLAPQVTYQLCLEELNLSATNLKELPCAIENLTNLEILKLDCPFLEILPASLGKLTSLKELTLSGCKKLRSLPDSVGELTQLTTLMISDAIVEYLPVGVKKLHTLEFLSVTYCPLREVPFSSLEKIEGEKRLASPHSRGRRLLESSIDKCTWMFRLKHLDLRGTAIKGLSFSQGVCPNLQLLDMGYCVELVEVAALPPTLISLNLKGCIAMKEITGLCGLAKLHISS